MGQTKILIWQRPQKATKPESTKNVVDEKNSLDKKMRKLKLESQESWKADGKLERQKGGILGTSGINFCICNLNQQLEEHKIKYNLVSKLQKYRQIASRAFKSNITYNPSTLYNVISML